MTMKRSFLLSILVLLAAFIVPVMAQDEASEADTAKPKKAEPTIKLLEQGAEPRRVLRFTPVKGATSDMQMLMRMNMKQSVGGMEMPAQKMPMMRLVTSVVIDDVTEEGDVRYTVTFTDTDVQDDPGVMPMVRQQMAASMRSMEGTTVRQVMTNRGIHRDSTIEMPADLNPMMAQQLAGIANSIEQFASPLPEESVGVGAKWRVDSAVTQNGMDIWLKTTYTITSINDGVVELDVQTDIGADPQDVTNPMLPPGATMRLNSMNGESSGSMMLSLQQTLPTHSQIKSASTVDIAVNMGGRQQEMIQQMEMEMHYSRVEKKVAEENADDKD